MIKNNNFLDSLSKSLLNDVRAVMEGKKKACKCENNCACGKEEKGEKKVDDEKAEMKNEAYDKTAVDNAINSSNRSGRKIGGREAKMIHALLKGRTGNKPKWTKDEADAHTAKVKADNKGVKEEAEEITEISKKLATDFFHKKQDKIRKDFLERGKASDKKGVMLAKDKIEGKAKVPATCKEENEQVEVIEAKESFITGTRLISKHMGKDGHHAEVRHNKDWNEYQVHHYENGKHMGEGPVSYHDSKEEAKETAEHEVKNYRPKNGSLNQVKESINEDVDFAKVRKQFDRNEDRNAHSKNAVLIAKHCGSEVDHKEAKDILRKHNELGHLAPSLMTRRSALYDKLKKTDNYKKIFPEESVKEEAEKMKGKDPCWKDYKMIGTKKGKGGKEVPNCVPEEVENVNIEEGYGDKRDHKVVHISVDGKYIASTTWAKNAEEAKKRFLQQHPEHKNKRITTTQER